MSNEIKQSLKEISSDNKANAIFGPQNKNLKLFEEQITVNLNTRGNQLIIKGSDQNINKIGRIINELEKLYDKTQSIEQMDIVNAIRLEKENQLDKLVNMYETKIVQDYNGRMVRAKNLGQQNYIHAIQKSDISFGIGPAGTGKTFIAVAMAVSALKNGQMKRIVLTRPAVESGENLGFLPGDLKEKVDPYLRPLYDSLYTLLGAEHTQRLMEREVIEIAPLAYMRGRTLDDAFIILDEAQNTTIEQMKMFMTRLGFNSKMVINGDVTQIDLPKGIQSGLKHAIGKLKEVSEIKIVNFEAIDVIRHPLVAKVITAYETDK